MKPRPLLKPGRWVGTSASLKNIILTISLTVVFYMIVIITHCLSTAWWRPAQSAYILLGFTATRLHLTCMWPWSFFSLYTTEIQGFSCNCCFLPFFWRVQLGISFLFPSSFIHSFMFLSLRMMPITHLSIACCITINFCTYLSYIIIVHISRIHYA